MRSPPPCLQVQPSTASGDRLCKKSWVLDEQGQPLLDEHGSRVQPRSNEPKLNLLMQWSLLVGATNGSSRGWERSVMGQLLMQPESFLRGTLAAAVETEGSYCPRVRLLLPRLAAACPALAARPLPLCCMVPALAAWLRPASLANTCCPPAPFPALQHKAMVIGHGAMCHHVSQVGAVAVAHLHAVGHQAATPAAPACGGGTGLACNCPRPCPCCRWSSGAAERCAAAWEGASTCPAPTAPTG